ncbi:hypothetical protein INR49_017441 [Caranx melampygus]|nr:hypothetical protein INR49_017441 [Caranx melampygus]
MQLSRGIEERMDLVDLLREVHLLLLMDNFQARSAHQTANYCQVTADTAVDLIGHHTLVSLSFVQELLCHINQVHGLEQRQQQTLGYPSDAGPTVQSTVSYTKELLQERLGAVDVDTGDASIASQHALHCGGDVLPVALSIRVEASFISYYALLTMVDS